MKTLLILIKKKQVYCLNEKSGTYELVEKPFIFHNFLLTAFVFSTFMFFAMSCYYYSENEKSMNMAPEIARNAYSELEQLKNELVKQRQNNSQLSGQ
ncbi:MAG: hypothetical protein H0X62_13405 [Bacteroidetes bacterium]|nr:hypothetical protein [Bacteroidota bacterium]